MHEILDSLYEKNKGTTHIFAEIFRYGTLGQEWLPKTEAKDPIQSASSTRPVIAQPLSTHSSKTSLPSVNRLHRKSQCTLCNFDPSLIIPSLKAAGYEIPLQVKGQCYHIQAKDRRTLNAKPDKICSFKYNSDQDARKEDETKHAPTPVRQPCTWKDSAVAGMFKCEDTTLNESDRHHQISMPIDGHGFEDCNCLSNWHFDLEDKSFIQAITLRNKAWHPDTRTEAAFENYNEKPGKEASSNGESVRVGCKKLKRKRHISGKNAPAVLHGLCETIVRSNVKNSVGVGRQAKVSELRFPPLQLQMVKPVQRLKEIGFMNDNETKIGKFSSLRPKLGQNDGEFRRSLINKLPLQLHSKSQVCTTKMLSPAPLSVKIDTKLSLDSSISKKRLELPFRLPQLRVLPSIGSASIPQLGKSTMRRFKGEVSGHTVIHNNKV